MPELPPRAPLHAVFVVGTRPEAIKMLPLIVAVRGSSRFEPVVVSTGQHAELVARVLQIGGIEPDVTFELPPAPRTLNELYAAVLVDLERYMHDRFGPPAPPSEAPYSTGYPAACFVHGDTSSAAAAALAAFHLHLPVVHVEAGLRTNDTLSPFPEELNRQLISRIAAWHLAPTEHNKENLIREGIRAGKVFVTGNTAIDALHIAAQLELPFGDPQLADIEADERIRVVAVTAHRRENWGEPLERVAEAVGILAESHRDVRFVVALHPNPDVAVVMRRRLTDEPNVSLVGPMGYAQFARLLARSAIAITDSGGIQEEAPSLGTPVVCVRESTERQEGVDAGTVHLVGTDTERIVAVAGRLLDDPRAHARAATARNPYGDGHAAQRIVRGMEHLIFDTRPPQPFGPPGFDRRAVLHAAGSEDPVEVGWVHPWGEQW
ncbi:UDP-N-acetylglucosamine 2-epimerase (non-hydrolyzing) [Microbacterium sp. LRZ72]|uniref:non-hydrolyzing UDP-N-acetylglucosamine 2-epimerase n=1 Tax=Microbacterium sp. LRZ72 TaxID=2942481 RepID=UPI0029BF123D|nr:UDP-N-acetylglucosamine 2-epimerase (non-hydrolyzing) [Microbacterium sp. LRZ72]MDX2375819.1 UDP-N-acetylglucosamine 2-epimerase (non-hydrolyzing) [Microbacterium sp. LRZ72]